MLETILKNDWYKTATKEEMRISLMHLQQHAMDRLANEINERKNQVRDQIFEECATACGWSKSK